MDYVRQTMAMAAVLGLLAFALEWLRRRGQRRVGRPFRRRLEWLERLPLGPQHTLHLIRAGEEQPVIACSPGGCAVLERMAAPLAGQAAEAWQ